MFILILNLRATITIFSIISYPFNIASNTWRLPVYRLLNMPVIAAESLPDKVVRYVLYMLTGYRQK